MVLGLVPWGTGESLCGTALGRLGSFFFCIQGQPLSYGGSDDTWSGWFGWNVGIGQYHVFL